MTTSSGVAVRPARCVRAGDDALGAADLAAVVALVRRGWDRWASSPSSWMDEDWVESLSTSPETRPEQDCLVVEVDGRLVAYVNIRPREPFTEVEVSAHYDPDLTGDELVAVVRAAIEAGTRTALARGADPARGSSLVFFSFADEPANEVLQAEGYVFSRAVLLMERQLDGSVTALPVPSGVTVQSVDVERDLAALNEVSQAFEDHRGDYVADIEELRHDLTRATSRPDLSLLARDADGPVAGVVVAVDDTGGVVEMLMTVRRARGRGIGSALLTQAFVGLRDAGQSVVYLMVDSTNPTGALGVYERAGMTVADNFAMWTRPLAPPPPTPS